MRNNFLNKDIEIDFDNPNLREEERNFASWKHIITAYQIDVYSGFLERNVDLTEEHVYPNQRNKMRVKLMMQVFSQKMARFVEILARSNGKNPIIIYISNKILIRKYVIIKKKRICNVKIEKDNIITNNKN